jgi:hypothetical protein
MLFVVVIIKVVHQAHHLVNQVVHPAQVKVLQARHRVQVDIIQAHSLDLKWETAQRQKTL